MITYLNGTLAHKAVMEAIIECNGVGYDVKIPTSTYHVLPSLNEPVKLLIHYHNSDDGVRLFGFGTDEERSVFRKLINISHIGPKTALVILSSVSINDLVSAVIQEDISLLTKIPGLGKKTAQRIVIELKDASLEKISLKELDGSILSAEKDKVNEAASALLTLGYNQSEINSVLKIILEQSPDYKSEDLIKQTIKYIYNKRRK